MLYVASRVARLYARTHSAAMLNPASAAHVPTQISAEIFCGKFMPAAGEGLRST